MQDLAEVSEALAEEQSQAHEQRQTLSFLACQGNVNKNIYIYILIRIYIYIYIQVTIYMMNMMLYHILHKFQYVMQYNNSFH